MSTTVFFRTLEVLVSVAVQATVLSYTFAAYRRLKLMAFAFWIWSCTLGIILMTAWYTCSTWIPLSAPDYHTFTVIYRLFFIVDTLLSGIGSVMLLKHILAKLPPNKLLQATATAPASCD